MKITCQECKGDGRRPDRPDKPHGYCRGCGGVGTITVDVPEHLETMATAIIAKHVDDNEWDEVVTLEESVIGLDGGSGFPPKTRLHFGQHSPQVTVHRYEPDGACDYCKRVAEMGG